MRGKPYAIESENLCYTEVVLGPTCWHRLAGYLFILLRNAPVVN